MSERRRSPSLRSGRRRAPTTRPPAIARVRGAAGRDQVSLRTYRRPRRRAPLLLIAAVLVAALAVGWWVVRGALGGADEGAPSGVAPAGAVRPPRKGTGTADSAAEKTREAAAAAERAVKVASYLGNGPWRDLTGFGPAPDHLNLKWKLRLGSGPTRRKQDDSVTTWAGSGWTGQPTVISEKGRTSLLLGAYDHNLHRIDIKTGKVVWESEWPDVMKGTNTVVPNPGPASAEDRLIVVSGSRRGSDRAVGEPGIAPLRAVSFATGKELWRLPVPKTHNYSQDVDSSPLWYKGVLYAPIEPGFVYALDPFTVVTKNGVKRPKVLARSPRLYDNADIAAHPDIGGANLALEASPAIVNETLYVPTGAGHIYGLDLKTLKVIWDFKTGSDIDGTPSVTSDGKLLVSIEKQYVSERGGAYLLDPTKPPKDAVVWYYPTPTRGFGEWAGGCVGSVTSNEASNDGSRPRLAALNTIDGALRVVSIDRTTSSRAKGPGPAGPAPAPVEVFTDGIGGSISTPVIVGDKIVTAGYGNRVYLYEISYKLAKKSAKGALPSPDGRWWKVAIERIDSFSGGAAFESTPLVYGRRVYIGNRDGYLYALGD